VEEGAVILLDLQLLDGVGGAPALVGLAAALEVAHLDLDEGAALAGRDDLDLEHGPLPAVVLDDVAGADQVGLELHGLLCTQCKTAAGGEIGADPNSSPRPWQFLDFRYMGVPAAGGITLYKET